MKFSSSLLALYLASSLLFPLNSTAENEPNNDIANANVISLNSITNGSLDSSDNLDYYKITTTVDGRLIIDDNTSNDLSYSVSLLDSGGKSLIKMVVRPNDNSGSRVAVNLSPGEYYIKFDGTGSKGSYTVSSNFETFDLEGDKEPNDALRYADVLKLNEQNFGNLGSRRNGKWDKVDYWKITILEYGRLTINDSTESQLSYHIDLYYEGGRKIEGGVVRTTDNRGIRTFANLNPGTYFLALKKIGEDYSTYGSYSVFPDFKPLLPGETEPNEGSWAWEEGRDLVLEYSYLRLNQLNYGNLSSCGYRTNIYGEFDRRDVWIISITENGRLTIKDTPESTLSYVISLLDEFPLYSYGSLDRSKDNPYTKEVLSEELTPGSYLIYLSNNDSDSKNCGSYTIFPEFIEGPKADFEIFQDIKTVSFNNKTIDGDSFLWKFDDGTSSRLENPSHTYSEPGEYMVSLRTTNLAGTDTISKKVIIYDVMGVSPSEVGNNGEVTLTIMGGSFSENSIVKISKDGSEEIESIKVIYFKRGAIEATFKLENADIGSWDVKVETSGKQQVFKKDAFNIVTSSAPEPWVNLLGRTKTLYNRWQTYTLEFGNSGNVDADLVPVWITISNPEQNEIEFLDLIIAPSDYMVENGLEDIFNSIPNYIDIDTLWGEANPTRVYSLLVPKIPAGYSSSIQFRIKAGKDIEVHAWNNSSFVDDGEFAKCQGYAFGDCLAEFVNSVEKLVFKAAGMIPGAACITALSSECLNISRNYDEGKSRCLGVFGKDITVLALTCIAEGYGMKYLAMAVNITSELQYLHDGVYKPLADCLGKFKIENFKTKKIEAVSSFDPNEMVGPSGYGDSNYTTPINTATYTVFFENKSSASAPAQEIWIKDTLDLTKFNIDLFSFNKLTIGDKEIKLLVGQKEFSVDIDFRPEQELIGRVIGKVNSDDGSILVYFNSLDPMTMRENENPNLGVLPPNINSPDGEGNISFSVGLINPTNGMSFDNEATIVFDYNEPIITNKYSNTIDSENPTSKIESYTYDEEIREITLNLSVNDKLSGIDFFILYVSKNDSSFVPLVRSNSNSFKYTIEDNIKYKFYSVATDKVGNTEEDIGIADINFEVLGNTDYDKYSLYNIYPNPVQGILYIDSKMKGDSFIEVIDINGKTVITRLMKTIRGSVNLTSISRGVYYIRITNDEQSITKKFIIE